MHTENDDDGLRSATSNYLCHMRKQIGESQEYLVLRGGARQALVICNVEYKRLTHFIARATHDPDYLALVSAVQALSNELRDLERNLLMAEDRRFGAAV